MKPGNKELKKVRRTILKNKVPKYHIVYVLAKPNYVG